MALDQEILDQLTALLGRRDLTHQEMQNWWAGAASGGPQGNGLYPATDSTGFVRMLPSPEKVRVALASGVTTVANLADRNAAFAANPNALVYVNNHNGSPTDPANGVYEFVGGAARLAAAYYRGLADIVQPLVTSAQAAAVSAGQARDQAIGASVITSTNLGRAPSEPVAGGSTSQDEALIPQQVATKLRVVSRFSIWAAGPGTLTFAKYGVVPGTAPSASFTKLGDFPLQKAVAAAGMVTLTAEEAASLVLQPGEHLAIYLTGRFRYSGGADATPWVTLPGGLVAGPITRSYLTSAVIQYALTFTTFETPFFGATEYRAFVDEVRQVYQREVTNLGRAPSGPSGGSANSGDDTVIPQQVTTAVRQVVSFSMQTAGAGTLRFAKYAMQAVQSGNNVWTKIADFPLQKDVAGAGLVTLSAAEARTLVLQPGEHLGFYTAGRIKVSTGSADPTPWVNLAGNLPAGPLSRAYNSVARLEYSLVTESIQSAFFGGGGSTPAVPASVWKGARGCLLGNSLTYASATGNSDVMLGLERLLGVNFVQSSASPGRDCSQVLDATAAEFVKRGTGDALTAAHFADVDFVLCNVGSAEFANSQIPLGFDGDTATNTFWHHLDNTFINKIQTWNPAIRIILTIDTPRFDGGGVGTRPALTGDFVNGNPTNAQNRTFLQYINLIRAWGDARHIPLIDLWELSGVNRATRDRFLVSDRLHISTAGYNRTVPIQAAEMERFGR